MGRRWLVLIGCVWVGRSGKDVGKIWGLVFHVEEYFVVMLDLFVFGLA